MASIPTTCSSSAASTISSSLGDGNWIPQCPQQDDSEEINKTVTVIGAEILSGDKVDFKFKPGTLVEVCGDGLNGVWFCATLIERKAGWKFLVEYQSLLGRDLKHLREDICMTQIRPRPPKTDDVAEFKFMDEVDAYYRDGWWVGVVSQVLGDSKYIVYFRNFKDDLVFEHSQLRVHQDWVHHKWV